MKTPYQEILLKLRQTGRTTRMIEFAIEQEKAGRSVYIITSPQMVKPLKHKLLTLKTKHIKIEDERFIPEFCWLSMTVPGCHPNCLWIVDHHVIEKRLQTQLEMMHRFDKLTTPL